MDRPGTEITRTNTAASARSFLSRPSFGLSRKGSVDANEREPKGPLGLTTLHVPVSEQTTPVADLVFVHGLNGGSHSTWSRGSIPECFWPRQWLPEDEAFKDVRIHTFGYPSGVTRESIINVSDIARSLLAAVKDSPIMNKGKPPPLIFIAHSMGGLVVKKAYIIGHREIEFKPVADRVSSIFFLATPHQGAAIAQTLSRLTAMIGARPFVEDLFPQSPLTQSLGEDFPRVSSDLQLFSFFETRPMTVGVNRTLIVDKASAVMNLPNERRTFLDADHRNVAMFSTPDDPSYVSVRNALATVISFRRETTRLQTHVAAQEDQEALDQFMGISDGPEDDILIQESIKLPGSCEWIATKSFYQSWKASMNSSFLWLRGRPGAGKSVLCSHIISDLRNQDLDCSFFFFQARDHVKSTANGFLRSIAWQMATLHPGIREKLAAIKSDWRDNPIDKIDANSVWRKIFLSGILRVKLSRPQYWVIDAMDECKAAADILSFLSRIQEHWPLSILITSRDTMDAHQKGPNPNIDIRSHTISEQDSLQDISILLKANMASLPCPASAQWPTREEIAAQILKRSAGCFLWASIICSELRLVTSEREITKVMESTPLNMDAVYHDILAKMESARFGKAAAKAFIAWTTYAFRPLSVSEIQTPVEMDINDKIDDVQRTISRCCGSLVFVDNNNKVQLVHLTAREFFTRKGAESEFILTKAEGHRRLAAVCLKFLLQNSQKSVSRPGRRLTSEPDITRVRRGRSPSPLPPAREADPFTHYASQFLFQHLKFVHSNDEELLVMLSDFLGSNNLLRWIEFTATNGDLRTIYQAGKTINSILNRRAQHSPPVGLARKQGKYALLEKWGDDLIHLVTNFSGWLRRSPKAIHHLIPPFCPPDSAIRRQFTNPVRGLNVQGLSSRGWNDCLTTITYPDGMKLNALAAGPGYFAVGMLNMTGQVLVYDDTIFQEVYILHHREPVWGLVFAESGKYVASAGARTVRIWCLADGSERSSFKITSLCLSLAFVEEDAILRVATKQNRLIDWDVEANAFVHDDPVTWTADLPDTMQFRTPMLAELGMASHLLAVLYRGENIVFWDCIDNRVYDTYEKETGSIQVFGSRKLAEGSTTVRAAAFGHSLDVNLFAATYTDGDLVVYDIDRGEVVAVVEGANTMVLATSQDGRTLAGADSVGNFTLFEFETLRALYRVRFDTQILPTALCFTSDSLRFIEIRAGQCRVWEPTVLLRTDMQDDDHSDTVSVSTGPQEVDHQILTNAVPEICSIACCPESSVVFCGMEDGSVLAHDTSGPEPEQRLLFVQDSQCGIHLLHFDSQGSTLSCGDRSGRFTVRKLLRPDTPRHRRTWEVAPPMIDGRTPGQSSGVLRQILSSSRHQRLLVSTEKRDKLWPMPKQGEGLWICQLDCEGNNNGSRWLTRPGVKSDLLLLIGDTGVELKLYDWATLDLVRVVSLSAGQSPALDRFAALTHQQFFATYTKKPPKGQSSAPMSSSARQNGLALLWDFQSLENGTEPLLPQYNLGVLPTKVEHILGVSGSRLVLYMADHWIASVEIQLPGALSGIVVDGSFVRHFFLPNDWIGSMVINNMIFGSGRGGEIFLALRSELAIIKRGLEVTEDSGTFNSRRLNTGFWGASGGRVPFRHRAASSQS
ncbi:vegetative incompatibility protein HET-E-1 [Dichotomopilus funicola]|uniref:Vegetative incompatibility protein HET-E-1 n=1 Tax=Dichotomopilus funicola TaxID=1934379 RepID=A0AAN6ZI30_9PEZI|nr:vegetative incompatibility protein HET-E-1 [Dichotomopilus funicola]